MEYKAHWRKSPGGTPLYEVYKCVPPQRVWFLNRFGLKTGIDFEHFGLKLGMVIEGTFTKAYKLIFLPSNCNEKPRSFILLTSTASLLQQLLTSLIAPHVFELGFATRPKNACHVTGTGNRHILFSLHFFFNLRLASPC